MFSHRQANSAAQDQTAPLRSGSTLLAIPSVPFGQIPTERLVCLNFRVITAIIRCQKIKDFYCNSVTPETMKQQESLSLQEAL